MATNEESTTVLVGPQPRSAKMAVSRAPFVQQVGYQFLTDGVVLTQSERDSARITHPGKRNAMAVRRPHEKGNNREYSH
ncbi:hypothetical protein MKX08_006779 [Trichoderma sp. CBMAI-0020]|nr:hypothetical protein MKX08_006779 [Trichoderma sp. CBMAI-0020]